MRPRCDSTPRRQRARPRAVKARARVLAVAAALFALAPAAPAEAAVVERVVAIVGERAILLSDVGERARPYATQIHSRFPKGAQRAAQMSQMFRMVLDKMIDEELMRHAASQARLSVTAAEVEESIAKVARQAGLPPEKLILEAVKSGLTEHEYRVEMRRQVLEAKLLNLRVVGRIRITDEDLKAAYRRVVLEERSQLAYRPAWIVLRAPRGPAGSAGRALADRVVTEARAGASFADLARRFSADAGTRDSGGLLGERVPGSLPAEVERAAIALDVGQVSAPVRLGDDLVIVKVVARAESELPSFDEAREELHQRVYVEKMNRARQHWLEGLRKRSHVEVRL